MLGCSDRVGQLFGDDRPTHPVGQLLWAAGIVALAAGACRGTVRRNGHAPDTSEPRHDAVRMTTVPGGTGQRGRAVTRRVLWASVLALLLLSGPGCRNGVPALPAGNWLVESAIPSSFVWTLIDFPGVGAIAAPLYTVQFLPDGTVAIGADCNRAGGSWSGGDGALSITVTTSTAAYCPPPSLSEYLQALNGVTGYTLLGTTLVLHGAAGDMTFSL